MNPLAEPFLILLILINLFALGTSRIRAAIQVVAVQGFLLGLMPLITHTEMSLRVVVIVVFAITLKAFLIPRILLKAMRDLSIQREFAPLISLTASLLLGALGTALAFGFSHYLPLKQDHAASALVPTSLSTVLTGFLILTTRTKAITQVLGYLILENGIFIFGLLLLEPLPLLVEAGVMLDLFVGVFVMGIIIHHVNQEFSSDSTLYLSALRE